MLTSNKALTSQQGPCPVRWYLYLVYLSVVTYRQRAFPLLLSDIGPQAVSQIPLHRNSDRRVWQFSPSLLSVAPHTASTNVPWTTGRCCPTNPESLYNDMGENTQIHNYYTGILMALLYSDYASPSSSFSSDGSPLKWYVLLASSSSPGGILSPSTQDSRWKSSWGSCISNVSHGPMHS